ncbi:MAG: SMI1/KNR4 family protein [Pirellulaceae bacterium]|nr:SMI1/KNR4 family protein [Pirellulaceae bacterium]
MASAASERLAERYSLRLSAAWRQWFDVDARQPLLAGQFSAVLDVEDLLDAAPPDLWPGFMLPDTLPIVSNDYGDWWCIRIGPDDQISEIIQWSHGGGDWLPVGQSIAEAALWDHVQQWRGPAIEVRQAAREYPPRHQPESISSSHQRPFVRWLAASLNCDTSEVEHLFVRFDRGEYRGGLESMIQRRWAESAATCELVEVCLQGQLARLADPKLASRCGINWAPEFTSWLFDTQHISSQARQLLREHAPDVQFDQDWSAAEHWSEHLRNLRDDLNWTGDICGWAAQRRGDLPKAIERYYHNRFASAFTDQSVRLRSHWFSDHYGKFSVAQLASLQSHLSPEQLNDPYLQLLWNEPVSRSRAAVREFWLKHAREALDGQSYAESYRYYTLAGWDLGAERMSDYIEILEGLVSTARLAGWSARAAVAAAHAECLKRRSGKQITTLNSGLM